MSCVSCNTIPNCISCSTGPVCSTCSSPFVKDYSTGIFIFNQANYACVACSSIVGCDLCTHGPTCTTCLTGYILISPLCKTCAQLYDTGCLTCDSLKCLTVDVGYVFNTSTCIFLTILSSNACHPMFNHYSMYFMQWRSCLCWMRCRVCPWYFHKYLTQSNSAARTCFDCSLIPNCQTCGSGPVCSTCAAGAIVNLISSTFVLIFSFIHDDVLCLQFSALL